MSKFRKLTIPQARFSVHHVIVKQQVAVSFILSFLKGSSYHAVCSVAYPPLHEITQSSRLYCIVLRTVALEIDLLETVMLKEVLVAFII